MPNAAMERSAVKIKLVVERASNMRVHFYLPSIVSNHNSKYSQMPTHAPAFDTSRVFSLHARRSSLWIFLSCKLQSAAAPDLMAALI
jgi:hypothetical protein